MKNQLFIILAETFCSMSPSEVKATAQVLKEAGLFSLPYPTVDIRMAGDCVSFFKPTNHRQDIIEKLLGQGLLIPTTDGSLASNFGDLFWMDFRNISLDHLNYSKVAVYEKGCLGYSTYHEEHIFRTDDPKYYPVEKERDIAAETLIVLLSVRNIVKTTHRDALAKLGIGKKKTRWEYTTTISLPKDLEDDPDHPGKPGEPKCPHLRRAHFRNQHHGPRNVLVKRIMVPATIVNADKEWTKTRTAYNISI